MVLHFTMTPAQARSLLLLATAAEDRLRTLIPDGRKRSAAMHALDLLKDAVAGHEPRAMDLDLQTLAEVLGELRDAAAVDLFETRVRDLLAVAMIWRGLEQTARDARQRRDDRVSRCCEELLVLDEVDAVPWRSEAIELLDDLGVAVVLPGERT